MIQVIRLDQPDAGRAILAINDRGVKAGVERRDDGGLQVVGRSQAGRLDVQSLRAILPVIVRRDKRSVASVQLQDRVGQRIGDAEAASEGPIARKRTLFASSP